MEYELTDEQIKNIVENFCDSEDVVVTIVDLLNYYSVAKTEEDFIELVVATACRYESAKIHILSHLDDYKYMVGKTKPIFKEGSYEPANIGVLINEYMPIHDMIEAEVKIKYYEDYESDEGLEDYYGDDDEPVYQKKKKFARYDKI